MNDFPFDRIGALQMSRDGTMYVVFADGRSVSAPMSRRPFADSSALLMTTYLPHQSVMQVVTTRGDVIAVDIPERANLAPINGRPTIYLDQNHWSTLSHALHDADRVRNSDELSAATDLIGRAMRREVLLPISSAHLSETCKQVDAEERYKRGVTMAQLSAGWQLADPLAIRRDELMRAFRLRFHSVTLVAPPAITLEPDAIHAGRDKSLTDLDDDLPDAARWAIEAVRCIGGIIDVLLDADHVPVEPQPGWAAQFERFAAFLQSDPRGAEMKRKRTTAKFLADLGVEIADAAHQSGISPAEMSEWFLNCSGDVDGMPALGIYREVMHEKLCDPKLRWMDNDLTDMMYLTAAAGYCDHLVGERSHVAHIRHGIRRLGRPANIHTRLTSLIDSLESARGGVDDLASGSVV